jgi:hypothetical protein
MWPPDGRADHPVGLVRALFAPRCHPGVTRSVLPADVPGLAAGLNRVDGLPEGRLLVLTA